MKRAAAKPLSALVSLSALVLLCARLLRRQTLFLGDWSFRDARNEQRLFGGSAAA